MKDVSNWKVAAIVVGVFMMGWITLMAFSQEPTTPKPPEEKTVTITETELNQLVERRIAQQMIAEEKTLQARILEGRNWHVAIFEGTEYVIYTGPGSVVGVRPYTPPAPKIQEEKK